MVGVAVADHRRAAGSGAYGAASAPTLMGNFCIWAKKTCKIDKHFPLF